MPASQTFAKHLKRYLFIEAFTKWSRDDTAHMMRLQELPQAHYKFEYLLT